MFSKLYVTNLSLLLPVNPLSIAGWVRIFLLLENGSTPNTASIIISSLSHLQPLPPTLSSAIQGLAQIKSLEQTKVSTCPKQTKKLTLGTGKHHPVVLNLAVNPKKMLI